MKLLMKKALNELTNLQSGETFLLKDLFKGYEWNRLDRNIRLKLGILLSCKFISKYFEMSLTQSFL